jgi:hypothetical protein
VEATAGGAAATVTVRTATPHARLEVPAGATLIQERA